MTPQDKAMWLRRVPKVKYVSLEKVDGEYRLVFKWLERNHKTIVQVPVDAKEAQVALRGFKLTGFDRGVGRNWFPGNKAYYERKKK